MSNESGVYVATDRPYVGFWRGKQVEVIAKSSFEAQEKAAKKLGAKKSYEVTVMLSDVTHSTTSL